MKVRLVFEKDSQEGMRGLTSNTFSEDVEIKVPNGKVASLVAARCYDPADKDIGLKDVPSATTTQVILDYRDEQMLVGKLLTYIDATYADKEQREAHKSLIKEMIYGYLDAMRTRAREIVESQSK